MPTEPTEKNTKASRLQGKSKAPPRSRQSLAATIGNLERAASVSYDGQAATAKARESAWAAWLSKAGGDPVKARRLRQAAMLRGKLAKAS